MRIVILSAAALVFAPMAAAQPFHDAIPIEFQGTFGPNLKACDDEFGVDLITITANQVHYYEGDDYLLLGIAFEGYSHVSKESVPQFNGRFTSRMETHLLGEMNIRMEMATPDMLVRYVIKPDGEPSAQPADIWIRCPRKETP